MISIEAFSPFSSFSRPVRAALLLLCALLCFYALGRLAVASNLGDTWRGATLSRMVDGTAERPYVTRALLPALAGAIVAMTPAALREAADQSVWAVARDSQLLQGFAARRPVLKGALETSGSFYLRGVTAALTLLCLVGAALALHGLGLKLFPEVPAAAALAPIVMLLAVPPLAQPVAYVYDMPALCLAAFGYYCLAAGAWRWYLLWFALASLNKETAIFLCVFYAFYFYGHEEPRVFAGRMAAQLALFFLIRGGLGLLFADNPGATLVTQYWGAHLSFLLGPASYHGLVIHLAALGLLLYRWREKPRFVRAGLAAAALMLPAYFLFGKPGEYRVFYDVLPLLALPAAHTLAAAAGWLQSERA